MGNAALLHVLLVLHVVLLLQVVLLLEVVRKRSKGRPHERTLLRDHLRVHIGVHIRVHALLREHVCVRALLRDHVRVRALSRHHILLGGTVSSAVLRHYHVGVHGLLRHLRLDRHHVKHLGLVRTCFCGHTFAQVSAAAALGSQHNGMLTFQNFCLAPAIPHVSTRSLEAIPVPTCGQEPGVCVCVFV